MKTTLNLLSFDPSLHLHQQQDIRSVRSLQNLSPHLNQNFNTNVGSHLSYHPQKVSKKQKCKKPVCPILQPQQPQNYLNNFDGCKQVSLISCKSQPLNQTRCKKSSQIKIRLQSDRNPLVQNSVRFQENDNKKTRKYFTKPFINESKQFENHSYREYYQLGKCEKDFSNNNTRQTNIIKYNQQTLRIHKKKCPHKSRKNLLHTVSLQNLSSRLSMCQAYIQLGQKKTTLLAQQVDFLLRKQHRRHESKMHKIKSKQPRHHKHHHQQEPTIINNFQSQNNFVCKHKNVSIKKRKNKLDEEAFRSSTPTKFHFRSCQNKSSSRMRELIYFHQKDNITKKHTHQKVNHHQKCKEETSIYQKKISNNKNLKIKNQKTELETKKSSTSIKNSQRPQTSSYSRVKNVGSFIDKENFNSQNMIKSTKEPYHQSSQYLLQQYENDTLRQTKQYDPGYSRLHKSNLDKINFPYINSQQVAFHNSSHQSQNCLKGSQIEEQNVYLTNEFQISQDYGKESINPKQACHSQYNQHQSLISNQSSIKSDKNRKIGQFTQNQRVNQTQEPIEAHLMREKYSITPQKLKQGKGTKIVKNGLYNSQKSGQQNSQKQYTFINYDSNHKNSVSGHFQVIDSNFNSPQHFDYNLSSNQNTQTQLIRQFDQLVIAAAQQGTPLKKKLIREQIYRTSKQIKQLHSHAGKSDLTPHMSRSIQHQ